MAEHGRMMADGPPDADSGSAGRPDLDAWVPKPNIRVRHCRRSSADADALWRAAREVRLRDAALLGRLVQWRIPGTTPDLTFDELFHRAPFCVLLENDRALLSGIVGRIWTLRRDYPKLADAEEFRTFKTAGTARVAFAMWSVPERGGGRLNAEVRLVSVGAQGRVGVAAVRPLIAAFNNQIGSDGLAAAVRSAEGR